MKSTIQAIYTACGKQYPTDADTLKAIDFISELIDENHSLEAPDELMSDYDDIEANHEEQTAHYSELFDAIEELESKLGNDDFYFEFDGNEYRLISESAIWDIYVDEIKNIVNDCYDLKLDNIPSFVAWEIDWEQTAKNAYVDGYGHTFSGYDGSELEIVSYYVFRTN